MVRPSPGTGTREQASLRLVSGSRGNRRSESLECAPEDCEIPQGAHRRTGVDRGMRTTDEHPQATSLVRPPWMRQGTITRPNQGSPWRARNPADDARRILARMRRRVRPEGGRGATGRGPNRPISVSALRSFPSRIREQSVRNRPVRAMDCGVPQGTYGQVPWLGLLVRAAGSSYSGFSSTLPASLTRNGRFSVRRIL